MSEVLGNFDAGSILATTFNTEDAGGAKITIAGTPSLQIRKNAAATVMTITPAPVLTVDLGGVIGLHGISLVLSDAAFVAGEYDIELATGTVDGISQTGTKLVHFSIGRANADAHLVKQLLAGKVIIDRDAGTIKVYDTDDTTLMKTLTLTTVVNVDTVTPS